MKNISKRLTKFTIILYNNNNLTIWQQKGYPFCLINPKGLIKTAIHTNILIRKIHVRKNKMAAKNCSICKKPEENLYCDFYMPEGKIHIEFFGLDSADMGVSDGFLGCN